jgi:hypothetical protein
MQHAALARAMGASTSVSVTSAGLGWRVGQIVSARVLATGAGGGAVLQVGSEQVQARSRLRLEPGQILCLRVESSGPPLRLRVHDHDADRDLDAVASQVLRDALPAQRPLAESLGALHRLSTLPATGQDGDLPDPVRSMLCDLMASLPRPQDAADPARLAAMVRSSGLFHEAEQARSDAEGPQRPDGQAAPVPAAADLKARIAAVADALQQGAGECAAEGAAREARAALHGALGRIEANQALSARASSEQAALWRVDLPLADVHAPHRVELRIRRDGAHDADEPPRWVAEMVVAPPGPAGQGPVHARLTLRGGTVHTVFTTEDPVLCRRLEARSDELARRMAQALLQVGSVDCRRAPLPEDDVSGARCALLHDKP